MAKRAPIITWEDMLKIGKCPKCDQYNILISKQLTNIGHTYGIFNRKIAWRVRCITHKCQDFKGVILKPNLPDTPLGPFDYPKKPIGRSKVNK